LKLKESVMKRTCAGWVVLPLFVLALAPRAGLAQSTTGAPPHVPLQKTIGVVRQAPVPSLIVMNARGATLQGGKLTLAGVTPNSIVFADRPVRSAGHALTSDLLEQWSPDTGGDSFAKNPPNATVSAFGKEGSVVRDAVVVLKNPKQEGDKLTFDVDVLEGDLAGADGPASIFIDIIGLPFTPLSFAGAARRNAFRSAWYAGGAAAVAAGAAMGGVPTMGMPDYSPPCGYGPYPPCL
jgi:hypothetical protein